MVLGRSPRRGRRRQRWRIFCSCKIQVPSSTHPGSMHFVRAPPYWTLNTSFGLTPFLFQLLKWARTAAGAETFSLRHVSGEFRCLFALPACGSLWSLASVLPWAGCAPLGPLGVAVGCCGSSWLVSGFGPGDPDAKSFWRGGLDFVLGWGGLKR